MMNKTKIINILNKNEMTVYDCGKLFAEVGKLFHTLEKSIVLNAEYAIEDAEGMVERAKKHLVSIQMWNEKITEEAGRLNMEHN